MGDQAIAGRPGTRWSDRTLERAARGQVALPFATTERSRRDQHRRVLVFALVAAVTIAVANAAVLIFTGIMPGLRDPAVRGPDTIDAAVIVLVVVPAIAALVLYGILWLVVLWGVRDADGRPWRYEVTADGFAVIRSDCTRLAAPWKSWGYEGYSYRQHRGAVLAISALHLTLDGRAVTVELLRTRRPRRLARALLQGLAAHGRADG